MNRANELRHSNPYRVPDGYFADLRQSLREQAAMAEEGRSVGTVWQRIRSAVGWVAAFGCLVLLATAGFYWTGYRAQQHERIAMQEAADEMLSGYYLYSEDVADLDAYLAVSAGGGEEQNALFTEAVTDYLAASGYGETDLLAVLTETKR